MAVAGISAHDSDAIVILARPYAGEHELRVGKSGTFAVRGAGLLGVHSSQSARIAGGILAEQFPGLLTQLLDRWPGRQQWTGHGISFR